MNSEKKGAFFAKKGEKRRKGMNKISNFVNEFEEKRRKRLF